MSNSESRKRMDDAASAEVEACPDFWPDGRHLDPPTAACCCPSVTTRSTPAPPLGYPWAKLPSPVEPETQRGNRPGRWFTDEGLVARDAAVAAKAQAKGWGDALQAVAWCLRNGASDIGEVLTYVGANNPAIARAAAPAGDERE